VWAARSVVAALAILSLTGCSHSRVSGAEVAKALRGESFAAHQVFGKDAEAVNAVFTDAPDGVEQVVTAYRPNDCACAPVQMMAPHLDVTNLTLAAFVFDSEHHASCREANVLGVCLHKGNVVIVVRDKRAPAARRALVHLG
jgi:hypothetical protein